MDTFVRCAPLVIWLALFIGCSSRAESTIVPIVSTATATPVPLATATEESKSVELPTPQIQTAPQGYYQDDEGLRLAVAKISAQALPPDNKSAKGTQYVVLALALSNIDSQSQDVTGFPFTVWLRNLVTDETFAPELYAPSQENLWQAIDSLRPGTVKSLDKNQTLRGELFFQVPASAYQFELIWQPNAQRQWILSVPKVR